MEKVYLPLDLKIGQIIQLIIVTFFERYPGSIQLAGMFHHLQFSEIYQLKMIDAMDPERPDRFMGPVSTSQELRAVMPNLSHLDPGEKG